MAAEIDSPDNQPVTPRPDSELTADQKFYREFMSKLDGQFPNAFIKSETEAGEPVWFIRESPQFDPVGLTSTTKWWLTEDGIIGVNDTINGNLYTNDELLPKFREAKEERFVRIQGTWCYFNAGKAIEDEYSRFLTFDPRDARPWELEKFGLYLRAAEFAGEMANIRNPEEPKRPAVDVIIDNIKTGAGK